MDMAVDRFDLIECRALDAEQLMLHRHKVFRDDVETQSRARGDGCRRPVPRPNSRSESCRGRGVVGAHRREGILERRARHGLPRGIDAGDARCELAPGSPWNTMRFLLMTFEAKSALAPNRCPCWCAGSRPTSRSRREVLAEEFRAGGARRDHAHLVEPLLHVGISQRGIDRGGEFLRDVLGASFGRYMLIQVAAS